MKIAGQIIAGIIAIAIVTLIFSGTIVHLITDAWWFETTGFTDVFWTRLSWQFGIGLTTLLIYIVFLWGNYRLAMRFTRRQSFELLSNTQWQSYISRIPLLVQIVIGVIAWGAAVASLSEWETVLKFLNSTGFGRPDPLFDQDIGFYLFNLPFYESVWRWLFSLLAWALIISGLIYLLKGAINLRQGWKHLPVSARRLTLYR